VALGHQGAPADDKIGNYKIVRTIQLGQNSAIFEVSQEGTGKRFALKELLPSRSEDPDERRAFVFEAKLSQELRHPNIIRIHEFVNSKMQPYFVMDLFPGFTLRLVVGKPSEFGLPKGKSHTVMKQTAEALAYLHEKGWAHRDVKPENILVNRSGEVRLIDFALTKRIPSGLGKYLSGKPPREGTYSYLSPDVIRRMPPSAQADIYSFGVTCYELATGRQPFRADSPMDLLRKHLQERPIPPTSYNKMITPEFSDLVLKMLEKTPAKRLQNLREFSSIMSRIKVYSDDPSSTVDMM
jgi:eukaryotic-like serine/threonine-protein kinase